MRKYIKLNLYLKALPFPLLCLLVLTTACKEIANLNDEVPEPDDLITSGNEMISTLEQGYIKWWQGIHDEEAVLALSVASDAYGLSRGDFGTVELGMEPRVAYQNNDFQTEPYQQITEKPWFNSLAAVTASNDVLNALLLGVTIDNGNAQDESIKAAAHLLRGLSWGYLGLMFYEGLLVTEATDLNDPLEFVPYSQMIERAVEELETAIAIAEVVGEDFVHNYFNGVILDADGFIALAHSYSARFLVQYPRIAEEYEQINWEAVLYHTERGLTENFAPLADGKDWQSYQKYVFAETGLGPFWARVDQRIVALFDPSQPARYPQMDSTGQTALRQKQATSEDARLQTDFIYEDRINFKEELGEWHFSHYKHHRNRTDNDFSGDGISVGVMPVFTVADVELLRAEALLNLGAANQAIDLLNIGNRVSRGELPLLDRASPPEEIKTAIFYERTIELLGSAPLSLWYDRRRLFERVNYLEVNGNQGLQIGTPAHLPVPYRELIANNRTTYTFGGSNDPTGVVPLEE